MLREAESVIKKEKLVLYIGETKKKRKASKTLKKGKAKKNQVLVRPRRLARCEMDLKMGNRAIVATVIVGEAIGGYSYFITFTDDFSRYGHVYLMKYKSEAFEKFREYKNKWTPPYTPQLNDVSERRNHMLLDMVQSMMSFADLPISFWGYALETIAYLLNRVLSKSVVFTPYEIWKGKKPELKIVMIWGCPAHVRRHNPDKLELRIEWCTFMGYLKYQADPGLEHWKAVKCILKYLRMTKDLLLVYGGGSLQVEGYTNSSFQSNIDDSKSNSGYVFTLNGGVVSWKSSKQDTTANSTIEAEYIAVVEAARRRGVDE
ncbi:hypothetical protein OPV22_010106 [Ensete ventricosum]|uniref:Integrase catalytic domain-containing protein n=1 Tax=Ensete ventricosum TaxID=4639 RepID=A0AAV8PUR3_ENSVE|nr:hypothetical protein OPV22_010106 [Ensete ventricosum]